MAEHRGEVPEERMAKDVVRDVIAQARRMVRFDPAVGVDEAAPVGRDGENFLVRVRGLLVPLTVRPCDLPS